MLVGAVLLCPCTTATWSEHAFEAGGDFAVPADWDQVYARERTGLAQRENLVAGGLDAAVGSPRTWSTRSAGISMSGIAARSRSAIAALASTITPA